MDNVELREFNYIRDIKDLCEWHKDHVAINFPDSMYKERIFQESIKNSCETVPNEMFTVYFQGNKVGFLWLKSIWDVYKDHNYCDLHYIHLIPEMRGKGIGKFLLEQTDEWAKKRHCKEVRLGTYAGNEHAIKAYEKAGYKIKRVVMEKIL